MNRSHDVTQMLEQLGLHHLRALDAILETGNVTRAAAQLGLSQSAISHQLSRLRDVIGDPLVVRARGGVVPTPRAAAMAAPIRRALAELEHAIAPERAWDARTAQRRFRLAMPEHYAPVVLTELLPRLEKEARGIDLHLHPVPAGNIGPALEAGRVDLVLGDTRAAPPALKSRSVITDGLACAVRRNYRRVRAPLDLDTYCQLSHLLISPTGDTSGIVDAHLAKSGRERRIQVTTPSFLAAPLIVASSNLLLTAPRRLLHFMSKRAPLRVLEAPKPLSLPRFTLGLLWHAQMDVDEGHRWLRGLMVTALGGD